ncbi:MAG TPA: alpha/beta hydrolase [Candidatus Saccharimonadales bacterium]|nr:alpha/beta hydrolase [Candidatus Saccharimonadales bacterium]
MPKPKTEDLPEFIVPLNVNGMQGRMLRLPSAGKKTKEILLIAGHHTSIERLLGVVEELNKYAGVTLPDLPGFGGMDSFYKIGKQPTLDNLADYLAAFIKLRYKKRQKFIIVGISFGFAVVTRMLQKYPDLVKRTEFVVSLVGMVHSEDFALRRRTLLELKLLASALHLRPLAWFAHHVAFHPKFIRMTYNLVAETNPKMRGIDKAERQKLIDFEIGLWQTNDIRTHAATTLTMFKLDLCQSSVDLPVYHVAVDGDRYFNNHVVEQHMRIIYNDFELIKSPMKGHVPTVIADSKAAAPFVPPKLRRLLARK